MNVLSNIAATNSSERKSQVRFLISTSYLIISIALILKENADTIISSLNNLSDRSEQLLKDGFKLTKDMKTKKIKDMKMIDEVFEKIIKKI